MTAEELITEVYEQLGEPSDLNIYAADGTTYTHTNAGAVKILRALNLGQKAIAGWKDPVTGRHARFKCLQGSLFFRTKVYSDTVSSSSNSTFPYSVVLTGTGLGTTDDQYNGWVIEINGEQRLVVDYTGSSYTFYLNDSFGTAPSAADTVKLYKRFYRLLPSSHAFVAEHISLPATTSGAFVEILKIQSVEDGTEVEPASRIEDWDAFPTGKGEPGEYYRQGDTIYFDVNQEDDQWFRMEYYRMPTPMSASTDAPELPENFHYAIALWANMWGQRRMQESSMVYAVRKELEDYMRSAVTEADVETYRQDPYGVLRRE